jgi:hypothetical protein
MISNFIFYNKAKLNTNMKESNLHYQNLYISVKKYIE